MSPTPAKQRSCGGLSSAAERAARACGRSSRRDATGVPDSSWSHHPHSSDVPSRARRCSRSCTHGRALSGGRSRTCRVCPQDSFATQSPSASRANPMIVRTMQATVVGRFPGGCSATRWSLALGTFAAARHDGRGPPPLRSRSSSTSSVRTRCHASESTSRRVSTMKSISVWPQMSGGESWTTGSPRSSARQISPASNSAPDR